MMVMPPGVRPLPPASSPPAPPGGPRPIVRRFLSAAGRRALAILGWEGWLKVAALLTALVAAGALVYTGRTLTTTQDQVAIAEQGQITERFTKAIELLGSETVDVRLGAIYALERLGRDSPADLPQVVSVLTAFVRGHAPTGQDCPGAQVHDPTFTGPRVVDPQPAEDIQAAVTVIGRRNPSHSGPDRIDLSETCLAGINLSGAHLVQVNLRSTNLEQADLTEATLDGADFYSAFLFGTTFTRASLVDVDFTNAKVSRATGSGAILRGAKFDNTQLLVSDLGGADLSEASFDGVDATGTTLVRAQLDHATLGAVRFVGVNLCGANLATVTFTEPDRSAAALAYAHWDDTTQWPTGFQPASPPPGLGSCTGKPS